MRLIAFAAAAVSALSTSVAFADAPPPVEGAGDASPAPATVASASPLPSPPPSSAAAPSAEAAPPPGSDTTPSPATGEPSSSRTGFVIAPGAGLAVLGGQLAKDAEIGAVLATFELQVGGYFSPKVGLLVGVKGGYGSITEGCAGCSALAYQFPIVLEYAFRDRVRGAYFLGGLALGTTYIATTGSRSEKLTFSTPVDFKLGLGYRIPRSTGARAAKEALDLRFGLDFGTFKSLDYSSGGKRLSGDIASSDRAGHVTLGLNVGYHFMP